MLRIMNACRARMLTVAAVGRRGGHDTGTFAPVKTPSSVTQRMTTEPRPAGTRSRRTVTQSALRQEPSPRSARQPSGSRKSTS